MLRQDARISLADLSAVGVLLPTTDAVTIVRELTLQLAAGELPGVPSAHVIRLASSGAISIEGPVAAGGRPISRAAQLLESLLTASRTSGDDHVPGALRAVIARALGTIDAPPYPSLESFAEALSWFAAVDARTAVQELVSSWAAAASAAAGSDASARPDDQTAGQEPGTPHLGDFGRSSSKQLMRSGRSDLTVSEIRRARRATGLPLSEISRRSRIPVSLLRQLEWGYLRNWPSGLYGRTQLVRYARAAGLDQQVVVETIWPMLDAASETNPVPEPVALVPTYVEPEIALITLDDVEPVFAEEPTAETKHAPEVVQTSQPLDGVIIADAPVSPAPVDVSTIPHRKRTRLLASLTLASAVAAGVVASVWLGVDIPTERKAQTPLVAKNEPSSNSLRGTTGNSPSLPSTAPERSSAAARPSDGASRDARESAAPPTVEKDPVRPREPDGASLDTVASSPAFASVGAAMFYQDDDENADDRVVRAGGPSRPATLRIVRVVDENFRNFHARPSPDGTRIAFDSDREEQRAVYVADVNGTNVRRVSGDGFAAFPSWAPDGKSLAFVRSDPDHPRVWNLWTVDLDSGHLRQLTAHGTGQLWGGSWFPDGRRIAYSLENQLNVIDTVTGKERSYPSPRKGRLVRTPAVSPDGNRIMFQVADDGAWLLDVADGSVRKVLADPSAEEYTWSPDGRRVAYHSRRTGEWGVWVLASR